MVGGRARCRVHSLASRPSSYVRRIWANGTITRAAGQTSAFGTSGNFGPASVAKLWAPQGLAPDGRFVLVRTAAAEVCAKALTRASPTCSGGYIIAEYSSNYVRQVCHRLRAAEEHVFPGSRLTTCADRCPLLVQVLANGTLIPLAGTGNTTVGFAGDGECSAGCLNAQSSSFTPQFLPCPLAQAVLLQRPP